MNSAHLHILLVHVPILFVPLATVILLLGIRFKNITLSKTALAIFILSALVAIAAFLLGEGAEDIVKQGGGVLKSTIHEHEEAGDYALWSSVTLGILSIVNFIGLNRNWKFLPMLTKLVLLIGIFSSVVLARTAQLGGMIRHPEAYKGPAFYEETSSESSDKD